MDEFLSYLVGLLTKANLSIWMVLGLSALAASFYQAKKNYDKQIEFLKDQIRILKEDNREIRSGTSAEFDKHTTERNQLYGLINSLTQQLEASNNAGIDYDKSEIQHVSQMFKKVVQLLDFTLDEKNSQGVHISKIDYQDALRISRELEKDIDSSLPQFLSTLNHAKYTIVCRRIEGANELFEKLRSNGFNVVLDTKPSRENMDSSVQCCSAIWVGDAVPARDASRAILIAKKHWSFLKYIYISGDRKEGPPEYVRMQLFLGGDPHSGGSKNLNPWTDQEFEALKDDITDEYFHQLIRNHYKD